MDNTEFANRISELRKQKGISQKELGDMLGVSNKAVSKWENGESMPKLSTMLKLAEILDVDGNELIGLESKDESTAPQINASEIDKLKSENAILTSKLENIDKRRKRILISVIFICIVGIIASGIIAFCVNADKGTNSEIKDAGEVGTKIIFSTETFTLPNQFQSYYMNKNLDTFSDYHTDIKYATYIDKNGEEHKVVVDCYEYIGVIRLTVNNKKYFYVSTSLDLNKDNIYSITIEKDSIIENPNYSYYSDSRYFYKENDNHLKFIEAFCSFYQNKGKSIDTKITQRFLGNDPWLIVAEFENSIIYSSTEIGEFFKDNDDNVYFYDYATAKAYSVGKELGEYVYKY